MNAIRNFFVRSAHWEVFAVLIGLLCVGQILVISTYPKPDSVEVPSGCGTVLDRLGTLVLVIRILPQLPCQARPRVETGVLSFCSSISARLSAGVSDRVRKTDAAVHCGNIPVSSVRIVLHIL